MIGKWNKSVILTYVGLILSTLGLIFVTSGIDIKYGMICLMLAGICDLFDGTVARRCKRTKEEKEFGIELDSLVDVMSFIALPIVILSKINKSIIYLPIAIIYVIFAVARLAYFNIKTADSEKAIKSYIGLPVTYAALIFPLVFLLFYLLKNNTFIILYNIITLMVAVLFILKINVPKPRLVSSIILLLTAIVVTIIYLFVL